MRSSLVKLNHVSTFSGKGQIEIFTYELNLSTADYRKYSSGIYSN
jgi:hypothetical protein